MSYSLRGTLIKSLLKVVTPLWLVACALLAFHAWHEVNELYEEQQTLFARQLYGTLPTLGARNEPQLPQVGDSDHQAVAAWNRGGQLLLVDSDGLELDARPGYTGFASLRQHDEDWRVYYLSGEAGSVAVAQDMSERWEMIGGLLLTQGLLWLLLLPFALLALWWAVGRGLAPLAHIRDQLQQRAPDDATPLPREVPSELHTLIDAMNDLIERVAQTLQRERRFTADAAHELRSPLAAMRVQAEVAQLVQDPALRERALQQLMSGVDRSSHLLAQLLALSRVEAAEQQHEALDWPLLLQELGEAVSGLAASHHVTLQLPPAGHTQWPLQHGDRTLLLLMLRNLLDNAIRYGGGTVSLEADATRISVSDEGEGVAEALLDKVRERFYRPPGQQQTGSGLGLSIVERIAALHGLQLSLHNRAGGGLQAVLTRSHGG